MHAARNATRTTSSEKSHCNIPLPVNIGIHHHNNWFSSHNLLKRKRRKFCQVLIQLIIFPGSHTRNTVCSFVSLWYSKSNSIACELPYLVTIIMAGQILGSLCQVSKTLRVSWQWGKINWLPWWWVLLGIRYNHSATQSRSSVCVCVCVCVCVLRRKKLNACFSHVSFLGRTKALHSTQPLTQTLPQPNLY